MDTAPSSKTTGPEGTQPMRFVDLSVAIENDVPADPPFLRPRITYTDHDAGVRDMQMMYPGVTLEELPDGKGLAAETLAVTTHAGTHVDAPWHYHPTMNGGERAWTIDEVPLEWFFQPGVKLDFRHLPDGHVVTAAEIDEELARIGHELQPLEIVLMNTGAAARYGYEDYLDSGCGFGREATLHLTGKGVRVVGTDAWSWDPPTSIVARRYSEDGDASILWEGHKAGAEVGYSQIEKLRNLDALPPTGFTVACFPTKVKGASAGWTRAVALFDDEQR
jgi:kynurenine formamidase